MSTAFPAPHCLTFNVSEGGVSKGPFPDRNPIRPRMYFIMSRRAEPPGLAPGSSVVLTFTRLAGGMRERGQRDRGPDSSSPALCLRSCREVQDFRSEQFRKQKQGDRHDDEHPGPADEGVGEDVLELQAEGAEDGQRPERLDHVHPEAACGVGIEHVSIRHAEVLGGGQDVGHLDDELGSRRGDEEVDDAGVEEDDPGEGCGCRDVDEEPRDDLRQTGEADHAEDAPA